MGNAIGKNSGWKQKDDGLTDNRNIVILEHPSGSKVYLCGTAHNLPASAKEVEATIEAVHPAVVAIEMDPDRMKDLRDWYKDDLYGIRYYKKVGPAQIMLKALTGQLKVFERGLTDMVTNGPLMGGRYGGEFMAAAEAAERVGATLKYADRSTQLNAQRMEWNIQKVKEAIQRGDAAHLQLPTDDRAVVQLSNSSVKETGDFLGEYAIHKLDVALCGQDKSLRFSAGNSIKRSNKLLIAREVLDEVHLWSYAAPTKALARAYGLLLAGLDSRVPDVDSENLSELQRCGSDFMKKATGHALRRERILWTELDRREMTAADAIRLMIKQERDVVLARRLWEAAEESGGAPVVGVCGAGHVREIQRLWAVAGTPEVAAQADEYCRPLPKNDDFLALKTMAGAGAACLMWHFRKIALAGALVVVASQAPCVYKSVDYTRQMVEFGEKLAAACDRIKADEKRRIGAGVLAQRRAVRVPQRRTARPPPLPPTIHLI